MDTTPIINRNNVNSVRTDIFNKSLSSPYYSTGKNILNIHTDYDTFPYPRWFRGIPTSSEPVVAEREAGYRKRNDSCYRSKLCTETNKEYPKHCFEVACSTVYPCFDREHELYTKNRCIVYTP